MNKKMMCLAILIIIGISCIPNGYKLMKNQDCKNLYIKNDEFRNISFIQHGYFYDIFARKTIVVYQVIPKPPEKKYLRIILSYHGENWIFFTNAIIINHSKNKKVKFDIKPFIRKDEAITGGVMETADISLSDSKAKELLTLLNAPGKIRIRMSGKYDSESVIDTPTIKALIEIITYHFKK